MGVTAKQIEALRERKREIELAAAKLEERKAVAKQRLKEARDQLKELGLDPKTAERDVQTLYDECVERLEELEEILGIND